MSFNTVTSASPPGAGRTIDVEFDITNFMSSNNPVAQAFTQPFVVSAISRDSGQGGAVVVGQNGFTGVAPLNQQVGLYRGRMCTRWNNVLSGAVYCNYNLATMFQQSVFNITSDEPLCWRVVAVIATAPVAPAAIPLDNGVMISAQFGSAARFTPATTGFGVQYDVTGLPIFVSRRAPGGGLVTLPLPSATVVDNDWHALEFIISGATSQGPAQLSVNWDGVEQVAADWGPGTFLPDYASDPGLICLRAVFLNEGGGASASYCPFLYLSRFRVMGGPTLSSLF
jgi:hypothetical protein